MTSGNPSVLPGVKLLEEEGDDQPLVGEELARYRSVAATANFIAQDRPDVKFAVKELCRDMAKPTFASWRKMKKLARCAARSNQSLEPRESAGSTFNKCKETTAGRAGREAPTHPSYDACSG